MNEARNIVIEDGVKEEPPVPVKLTPEEAKLVETYKVKKMNRKEKVKHQARKDAKAEAEKIKEELAAAAAAAAAAEKKKKELEKNRRIDNKEAEEEKLLRKGLSYKSKRS